MPTAKNWLAGAWLWLLPSLAAAQAPLPDSLAPDRTLPEVFIRETKPSFAGNIRHVEAMTRSEMLAAGATSLSDALARLPGVSQLTTGPISKPVVRGLYGNRLQINLLGLRFDNQQWQDEHGLGLSDVGVERVELIKGPAALLFGSDALGGVINVVPETGRTGDSTGRARRELNLKMFSNTAGFGLDFGWKRQRKNTLYLHVGGENHADYTDGAGAVIVNSRFAAYTATGGWLRDVGKWRMENRLHLSLSQFGFRLDSALNHPPAPGRWSRDFDGPHHRVFLAVASSRWRRFFSENKILTLTFGAQENLRQEQEGGNKISLNMLLSSFSGKIELEKRLTRGLTWTNGAALLFQSNANLGSRTIIPDARTLEGSAFSYLRKSARRGAWLADFEAGLRFDRRQIETFLTSNLNPPGSEVPPFSRPFDALNGSVGASFLRGNFLFKADLASGFRSANLAELSSNGLHEGTARWEIGTTDLRTERCLNANLSATWQPGAGVELRGSLFRNRFLNFIFLAPTGTEFFGFPIYRYQQADATLQGFETGISWQKQDVTALSLDYSLLDSRRDGGAWLPFTPANRLQANARIFFLKKQGAWSGGFAGLGADFVSAQNSPAEFETATPAYTLVRASAGIARGPWRLLLAANNLTDLVYNDHLSRFKYLGVRDMGRSVSLTLSTTW